MNMMFPKPTKRKKRKKHKKSIMQPKGDRRCYLCMLLDGDFTYKPYLEGVTMDRLTEWIGEGEDRHAIPRMDLRKNGHQACCNKLAEYEDLEEAGMISKYIAKRISIDGGMCETCHEVPGYIVHHKIELTPDNISDLDIALGFNNLKYDCHICHQKENMKDGPADGLVKYEFDSEGEMVVLPPEK